MPSSQTYIIYKHKKQSKSVPLNTHLSNIHLCQIYIEINEKIPFRIHIFSKQKPTKKRRGKRKFYSSFHHSHIIQTRPSSSLRNIQTKYWQHSTGSNFDILREAEFFLYTHNCGWFIRMYAVSLNRNLLVENVENEVDGYILKKK